MDERVAETVGGHLALTSPAAKIWWKVAHGELSPDEAAARLLEGRELVGAEEREELERAKRVFAPVTAERRDELLLELLARRSQDEVVVRLEARTSKERSSARRVWIVGLAVAAAAVLVLWLVPAKLLQGPFDGEYRIEVSGMADVRGKAPEPEAVPSFERDETITVVLRPERDVAGPVEVVGFARPRGGEPRRLELDPRIESNGFVTIRATAEALALAEGTWELELVVGREGELPGAWVETGDGAEGYVVLRTTVEIVPRRER